MHGTASAMCADPLEMDDGRELIEMVCTSYESPDDAPEDDQHDFSESSVSFCISLTM